MRGLPGQKDEDQEDARDDERLLVAHHPPERPALVAAGMAAQTREQDRHAAVILLERRAVQTGQTLPLDAQLAGHVVEEEDRVPEEQDGEVSVRRQSRGDPHAGENQQATQVERVLGIGVGSGGHETHRFRQMSRGPEPDRLPQERAGRPRGEEARRRAGQHDQRADERVDGGETDPAEGSAAFGHDVSPGAAGIAAGERAS